MKDRVPLLGFVLESLSALVRNGAKMVVLVSVFSALAGVVIRLGYPPGWPFFVVAVVSTGAHMGGLYVRDKRSGAIDSKGVLPETVDKVVIVTSYVVYFTPLMVVTTLVATVVADVAGVPLLGALVALWTPAADFYLLWNRGWSPGSEMVEAVFAVLHSAGYVADRVDADLLVSGLEDDPVRNVVDGALSRVRGAR